MEDFKALSEPGMMLSLSGKTESIVKMGIVNLERGQYQEAQQLFNSALAEAHNIPASWLGKAYAEAYLFPSDIKYSDILQDLDNLKVFLKDDSIYVKHRLIILFRMLINTTQMVVEAFERSEQMKVLSESHEAKAGLSRLGGAFAGGLLTSSDDRFLRAAGYSAVVVGAASSISHDNAAQKAKEASQEAYEVGIALLAATGPIARDAYNTILENKHTPSDDQKMFNDVFNNWRGLVVGIYKSLVSQAVDAINSLRWKLVWNPGRALSIIAVEQKVKQISNLYIIAMECGFSNNPTYLKIKKLFEDMRQEIDNNFFVNLMGFIKKLIIWGSVILGIWVLQEITPEGVYMTVTLGGPILGLLLQGKTQKKLRAMIKTAISQVRLEVIDENSIVLERRSSQRERRMSSETVH